MSRPQPGGDGSVAPARWGGSRCRHGDVEGNLRAVCAVAEWVSHCGGSVAAPALTPVVLPGYGCSLVCTRDVPAGEAFVAIPADAALSTATVATMSPASIAAAACAAAGVPLSRRALAVLQLLAERAHGPESRWAVYIASLPDAIAAAAMCVVARGGRGQGQVSLERKHARISAPQGSAWGCRGGAERFPRPR